MDCQHNQYLLKIKVVNIFFFFKESKEYLETTLLASPSKCYIKKKSRRNQSQKMGMLLMGGIEISVYPYFFPFHPQVEFVCCPGEVKQ